MSDRFINLVLVALMGFCLGGFVVAEALEPDVLILEGYSPVEQ